MVNLNLLTYAGNRRSIDLLLGPADGLTSHPRHRFVHGDLRLDMCAGARRRYRSHGELRSREHVDRSIVGAAPIVGANVVGSQVLLSVTVDSGRVGHFHQPSTDEVYGTLPWRDPQHQLNDAPATNVHPKRGQSQPHQAVTSAQDRFTDRPGHYYCYAVDASRVRSELAWTPRITSTTGLASVITWYKTNPHWCHELP